MKLNLTTLMELFKLAPQVVGLANVLVDVLKKPSVTVVDSSGQPVSPTVIADLVAVATDSAVKGVQAAG